MDTVNQNRKEEGPTRRFVLDLSANQARDFFLKQESYCTIEFPPYIVFSNIIRRVYDVLKDKPLSDLGGESPKYHEYVNHVVMHSKD